MTIKILFSVFRPFNLITLVFTYALGGGLVQYVRAMRSWPDFFLGAIFLLLITISLEYMRLLKDLSDYHNLPEGMTPAEAKQTRLFIEIITAVLMTAATTIFVGWMLAGILWQGFVFLILSLAIAGVFYYLSKSWDPVRPFQVLIESLIFVAIPPAIAFFLQSDDLHRLLTLVVISIVPTYMGFRLLSQLENFASDVKTEANTLVTEMGWQSAMTLHNAFILLTYVLFALVTIIGFPWFLLWPVFLTLPIGLLEIWLMERVRRGGKPLWVVMKFATASVFLIPIYLIGLGFWIR